MSVNLIVDIGNSCSKVAVFDGIELKQCLRTTDELFALINSFHAKYDISKGIFSCVGKEYPGLAEAMGNGGRCGVMRVTGTTPVPLKVVYDTPSTLGADRLAAVVGAMKLAGRANVMVVDVGTCITYDFLNIEGEYLGGSISPGVGMRLQALHEQTAKLPLVEKAGELPEWGHNTETAIRSGVVKGIEYEIEGWARFAASRFDNLKIVATGGGIYYLEDSFKARMMIDENLVAHGLNSILIYNEQYS